MENKKDQKEITNQLKQLKQYNEKAQECLSAIQLLIVDDNNSRIKDESLESHFNDLQKQMSSLSKNIDNLSNQIN